MKVLITAANGNLGREIVSQLSTKVNVIAGVRNPDYSEPDTQVVYKKLDYDIQETYADVLDGVDAVVLQAPPLDEEVFERLTPFIDAIKESNIKRVIFNSAFGVDHNDEAPLRKIELKLIADGFNYAIIRPNFYMENFSTGFASAALAQENIVVASAGEGQLSFVSIQDVAEVITAMIINQGHDETEYNLTGSEALSHTAIASILSSALGEPVHYLSLSHEEFKAREIKNGLSELSADFLDMLYGIAEQGLMSHITEDIKQILGKKPVLFKEVASKIQNRRLLY